MEQARLLIAIVLSALIFLLWQLFFVDKDAPQQSAKKVEQSTVKEEQIKESKPYPKAQEVTAAGETTSSDTAIEFYCSQGCRRGPGKSRVVNHAGNRHPDGQPGQIAGAAVDLDHIDLPHERQGRGRGLPDR